MKTRLPLLSAARCARILPLLALCSSLTTPLTASNDQDDWSLGPVGGKMRLQPGTNYLKVQSVTTGAPGASAGLLAGDYIYGAFGQPFGMTGGSSNGYKGATQDLGQAIERAEAGNGGLPLTVLRPGVGKVDLTVSLNAAGGFGPAYPLGSPKYDAMYQWACGQIHSQVTAASSVGISYNLGLNGMILLSHPNWNDLSGAKPYRLSINRMKDAAVTYLNAIILDPVEATNMDGTPNDGSVNDSNPNDTSSVNSGLENWQISTAAMFLGEYRLKTGDTAVDATLQRAADALANRVQEYQQPPYDGSPGPTKVGLMGHGGVGGDYPHIGYSGINIINAHALSAMAMLRGAGASVNNTQFLNCWQRMKDCTRTDGGSEDGNVGYAWVQGGSDSTGRTAGAVFGMRKYGGISAANQTYVDRQEDYLVRHWQRFQHCHAYTVGGVVLYQFAMPYLSDREQRFLMENMKFFYQFHRNTAGTLDYFGGRENNGGDGYLNVNNAAMINVAMAHAVQSGNLLGFPAPNPGRIHADFKSPWLSWPTLGARYAQLTGSSAAFNVDVTNYLGTVLNAGDYTAAWTHVSGPATATFSNAAAASTTVSFPVGGRYRIQLTVTKGGYTLTEPVDLDVFTASPPAGYITGQANYDVYTGISGSTLANLTGAASYPASPTSSSTVSSLAGTYSGDNYGSRIRGFIIPPATGAYTFSIAADDAAQMKFGTSEAASTVICSTSLFTNASEWTKYPSQTSAAQNLTAGVPYFFEVLHKEGGGGDHVAVGWKMPGVATTEIIDGKFLAVQSSGALAIAEHPQPQTVAAGGSAAFGVRVTGAGPFLFQWRRNGVAYWPASTSPTLSLSNIGAGAAGNYDCIITAPGGTVTSHPATLTVTGVGTLTPGGLWRDLFNNIGGAAVADLTGDNRFPNFPDSGGVITSAEGPANFGDSFGERWTGWIKPDVTGAYKFFIASDDASELWLSTTDQPAQKVKIATVGGYTNARKWSAGGKSASINLTAGSRYYIEVRHKDNGGADHCAVAWQKPGEAQPADDSPGIAGSYLEYLTGGIYDTVISSVLTLVQPGSATVTIRPGVSLALQASASPPSTGAVITWTQESGPGTVVFSQPGSLATGASFSAAGSYLLRCTLDNGGLPSTLDVTVNVSSAVAGQWVNVDISAPRTGSGTRNANGSITVAGAGADIYGTSDSCHFFYQSLTGDFDVRSRIASKSMASTYGQHAALMARESTAANARNVAITHEAAAGVAFQYRQSAGSSTTWLSIPGVNLPLWQRLVRSGGNPATGTAGQTFTGYYSTDNGATWIQRSSVTYGTAMPNTLLVGFGVSNASSIYTTALNTVVFDNVSGFGTETNTGPLVSAGADQNIALPASASLAGSASDDGIPSVLTRTWSRTSGPGTVTFGTPDAAATTATFSQPGTYVLRLTASDTAVTTYDEVTVTASASSNLSVAATDANASEAGPDGGRFTFTRTGSLAGDLTVNFAISGTATQGADYATLPASVTLPNGASSVTLDVSPLSDALIEGPETVVITLADGAYGFDATPASVTISDMNHAPLWAADPFSAGDAVANVVYQAPSLATFGSDPDAGDTVTFAKTGGPGWLTLSADGTLGGTPSGADLGLNPFTVRITDAAGLFADATLNVIVRSNVKADNPDALGLGSSWVGGFAPAAGDVAVWNGAYLTAGSLSAALPGAPLAWKGVSIGNLTGAAAGPVSIGGTAAATASSALTFGSGGIDLSAANQNLVINSATTVLGASQAWSVPVGRNLRFGTTGTGGGNANVDGTAGTVVTVQGGGLVDANQGGGTGFSDAAGFAGYGGKWLVTGGSTLRGSRNGSTAWGSNTSADAITLAGGTLAVGGISGIVGNWTWTTPISLTASTSSSIDQQIATGSGRYLKLMGTMSGSGNLIFRESGSNDAFTNDDLGHIVTGTNSLGGVVTIGGATENGITGRLSSVRLGGVNTSNSTSTAAGSGGDFGTASVVNHGILTLSHSNTWTFGNTTSGGGKLRIGGGVSGAGTQDVTVSGNNSYSGGTDIATGILRVSTHDNALGGGPLAFTGSATLATAGGGGARALANPVTLAASATATLDSTHANLTLFGSVSGAGGLATTGSGTTILTANNSYGGSTTVGGTTTLRINGTHTGTGATTVAATARIEGNGTLPGTVAVSGTVAPGDGIGTLTTGAVTMAHLSKIVWQVTDWTAPAGSDLLAATSLDLTSATTVALALEGPAAPPNHFSDTPKTFTVVRTTGGITGFAPGKFAIDTTALTGVPGSWSVRVDGNDLQLVYTPAQTPFEMWQASQFGADASNATIAGDLADPDDDGLQNLIEYAVGSDPKNHGPSAITQDTTTVSGETFLRLTIDRNPSATDVAIVVETSGNLTDWGDAETLVESDTASRLIVRDTGTGTRRFIRVKVTR